MLTMTQWQSPRREPAKTKDELREMLAEAVRDTQPKPAPKAKRNAAPSAEDCAPKIGVVLASEKAGAEIQAVAGNEQRHEQANSAKYCDGLSVSISTSVPE